MSKPNAFLILCAALLLVSCGGGGRRGDMPPIPAGLEMLCGDPALAGERLDSFTESNSCGIRNPVRVHYVAGVRLNEKPTLNCKAATALADWVVETAKPNFARSGPSLAELRVFSSYACRNRNSQAGGKVSEHAVGNAIDIGAFKLTSGETVSVLQNYRSGKYSPVLHRIYKSACGTFGTTLSPDADRFHQDHFHFDVKFYGRSTYCR
ncbi:MAG TPA: extensin family protein [Paracoccaceae bacterium]|nr:extensin family protein [Paracoccaceae bacterium]